MKKQEKEALNKLFEETNTLKEKKILVIKTKPTLTVSNNEKGMELNDGYIFDVNGALPEIADGIAKLATELEPNGFGKGSGIYFIRLINEYFNRLISK